jgi:hypothetical protein
MEAPRASRVFPARGRVIVISPHHLDSAVTDVFNNLRRVWTVVHQVAQDPKLVVVSRKYGQRLKISMQVRSDYDLHEFLIALPVKPFLSSLH